MIAPKGPKCSVAFCAATLTAGMPGLHNTLRRLVAGGAPVITGLHAVGDSVCTTNPTLGRGLSLALSGAVTWWRSSASTATT